MPTPRPRIEPSFWNELYWFLAIGLAGWILAALILAPRVSDTRLLLDKERRVLADLKSLRDEENLFEGAVSAMENDPWYQAGVIRNRLKLRKKNEEYIEVPAAPGR